MLTNSNYQKKATKLPGVNTCARAVIDAWIAKGGRMRFYEGRDAYNKIAPSPAARDNSTWCPPGLTSIFRRYGTKENGARSHGVWVLDPQWMPAPDAPKEESPAPSPVVQTATVMPEERRRLYRFEVKIQLVAGGNSFAAARNEIEAQLDNIAGMGAIIVSDPEPVDIREI